MRRWIAVAIVSLWACSTAAPTAPPTPTPGQAAGSNNPAGSAGAATDVRPAPATASSSHASTSSSAVPSPSSSASSSPSSSAVTPAPSAAANVLPAALPKDTVVLHVGDSMADALGKDLKRELEQRGINNPLHYKEATYIPEWAGYKWQLSEHIARYNPDLVIVTLGGNEVAMPDPTVRADPVRRIVKKIGDRPCLWVAAPLWPGAPHTGILKVVKDNCAPCIYVDTNELMTPMEVLGDKVHPTLPERKRWAKFMVRWLLQNREPNGKRPWDFKQPTSAPPAASESWLEVR